jgi:hypothetical protein
LIIELNNIGIMKTVNKYKNNGFTAEIKRWVANGKTCYAVFSNDKLVYSNVFFKKSWAINACNEYLQKKANPLKLV